MDVIKARGLERSYGENHAVRGIDLVVRRGEYLGILGPNGAGKSTTISMISTVLRPSAGVLNVFGLDTTTNGVQIRSRLGVCSQDDLLDTELNIRQNLTTYGRYFGLGRREVARRADYLLEWMNLGRRASARVATLSGGYRRRLAIARALINSPELLLMDEPTTGLDPSARRLVWERLRELKHGGMTMVLTTHFMDEAEQLCDRVVVMDAGIIVAEGNPRWMISEHAGHEVVELTLPADYAGPDLDLPHSLSAQRCIEVGNRTLIYSQSPTDTHRIVDGIPVGLRTRMLVRRASLDDVYILLTGRELVKPPGQETKGT